MVSGPAPSDRRDRRPAAALLRAGVAVLALYAVLLQAFLGGLMPMPGSADGLCASQAAADQAPGTAVPPGHGDCCTAARTAGSALPPRPAPHGIAWTAGAGLRLIRPRIEAPAARAPPDGIAEPRGPPSA